MSLYSTFNFAQLFNDGAFWAFNILNNRSWHIEYQYLRYSTLILQTPAVLASKFSDNAHLTTWLFCLGYMIYPFIALTMTYFLFLRKKPDFLFVLFGIVMTCITPNWGFSVSIVNESIAIAFLLTAYALSAETPRTIVFLLIGALLLFSYEMGVIFYFSTLYILYREKKLNLKFTIVFLVLTGMQILNGALRILPANGEKHFVTSIQWGLISPFLYINLAFLGLLLLKKRAWKNSDKFYLAATTIFTFTNLYFLFQKPDSFFWGDSYHNRVWAIPMSGLLLMTGYEIFFQSSEKIKMIFIKVGLIISLVPLYQQFRLAKSNAHLNDRLETLIKTHSGCYVLNRSDWQALEADSFISTWSVPFLSSLHNRNINVKTLLFTEIFDQGAIVSNQFCQVNNDRFYIRDQYAQYEIYTKGHVKFFLEGTE